MTGEGTRALPPREFRFEEAEGRRTIRGPGLHLSFTRVGPRWTHALTVGDGPQRLEFEIACAIEGDLERDDPARVVSPSYQEIQPHASDQGVQVLLMGQSGPHHFSAVVVARREGDRVEIGMDIADRCRLPVAVLAGTYLVRLGSGALIEAEPCRIAWGGDALGRGRLEFATDDPDTVALAEAGRQASRVQALARIVPSTFTQRLRYRWRWTPAHPDAGAR